MSSDDDGTVTELRDVVVPRVDAVDVPAFGAQFLILKSSDLLAGLARVLKAKYDAATQRRMLAAGHAMKGPDGEPSYPIGDRDDVEAAVHAVGRGSADHDKLRRFIARRAKDLNATDLIPTDWAPDGSIQKASSMDDEALDALTDPGVIDAKDVVPDAAGLVAPTYEGDPDDVQSPAWEAVDAARARAAVEQVVWLKQLVADMQGREDTEVALTGDMDDAQSAIDLEQVLGALDCALAVLAKFAVDEQAEADQRATEVAEQAEALGIVKSIEGITADLKKAGRVLSAANEASLRSAHAALTEVLGRVPGPDDVKEAAVSADQVVTKAADDTDDMGVIDKAGTPAKDHPDEQIVPEEPGSWHDQAVEKAGEPTPTSTSGVEDAAPMSATVEKAGEPTPTSTPGVEDAAPDSDSVEKAAMSADDFRKLAAKFLQAIPDGQVAAAFKALAALAAPGEPDSDDAPAVDTTDTPTVADDTDGTPSDPAATVAATGAPDDSTDPTAVEDDQAAMPVAKSLKFEDLTQALKAAVDGPLEERIAKAQEQVRETFAEQIAKALEPLLERIEKVESTPVPGPMLNGMAPGADGVALRGQAAGAGDPLSDVKKMIADLQQTNPHQAAVASGAAALAAFKLEAANPSGPRR